MVTEKEGRLNTFDASLLHHPSQVLPPVIHEVRLRDLDLEEVEPGDERSQFSGALTAAASDADQKAVTAWLLENATYPGYVLDGETKHDEVHRRFAFRVVLLEVQFYSLQADCGNASDLNNRGWQTIPKLFQGLVISSLNIATSNRLESLQIFNLIVESLSLGAIHVVAKHQTADVVVGDLFAGSRKMAEHIVKLLFEVLFDCQLFIRYTREISNTKVYILW